MATQVIGVGRRSQVYAALVALALTLAVFVVVAQASSVLWTRTVPQVRPAPAQVSLRKPMRLLRAFAMTTFLSLCAFFLPL